MWFHIIQVPLTGLIALAVCLLTDGLQGRAVMVSRWAIGVFVVFFSAYDAAAGIGTGYALRNTKRSTLLLLPPLGWRAQPLSCYLYHEVGSHGRATGASRK